MKKIILKKKHSAQAVAEAASLFFAVRRVVRTTLAKGKKYDPTTWLHVETMKFIADHDKPKMKDLADYLSITAPSATSLVSGLVKSALVTCDTDRRDRRTSRLALTQKGKAELKATITRGTKLLGELFAVLSAEQLATFSETLKKIKEGK